MLVASATDGLSHRRAHHLPAALRPGDLLVINTSDTLPAALGGVTAAGERVEVHLSTVDPAAERTPAAALRDTTSPWVVELRGPSSRPGGEPSTADRAGTAVALAGGGRLAVPDPYPDTATRRRLWTAELATPAPLGRWLTAHGEPVRYGYTAAPWPLAAYRTGHADTRAAPRCPAPAARSPAGPSAGSAARRPHRRSGAALRAVLARRPTRPRTPSGTRCRRPPWTRVTETRRAGGRVVAVGTTVVRALESAARSGRTEGWTDLVVTPADPPSTVDGLLTGWHPPAASHLRLLAAIADPGLLAESYRAALAGGYLWHEFGDVHLILP